MLFIGRSIYACYDWGRWLSKISKFGAMTTIITYLILLLSLTLSLCLYLSFALSLSLVIQSVSQWAREHGNLGKASYHLDPFSFFVNLVVFLPLEIGDLSCFGKLVVFLPLASGWFFTFGELVVTLLKILTRTRKRVISKDIRPAIILKSIIMNRSW